MIAAALQLITFARSLSAKAWLVAIALGAILAAAATLVTYGEHREAVRIASIARADTIRGDLATLRVAQGDQSSALARLTLDSPSRVPQPSSQALLTPGRGVPSSSTRCTSRRRKDYCAR